MGTGWAPYTGLAMQIFDAPGPMAEGLQNLGCQAFRHDPESRGMRETGLCGKGGESYRASWLFGP